MQGAQVWAESRKIEVPQWNLAKRIAFRFVFPYMTLFHLGTLIGVLGTFGLIGLARAYRTDAGITSAAPAKSW